MIIFCSDLKKKICPVVMVLKMFPALLRSNTWVLHPGRNFGPSLLPSSAFSIASLQKTNSEKHTKQRAFLEGMHLGLFYSRG